MTPRRKARVLVIAAIVTGLLAPVAASSTGVGIIVDPPPSPLRVFVVVIDGLSPSEVGPLTPNLSALKATGTWYQQARGVLVAETIPNHVAMATGVAPDKGGVVANTFIEPGATEPRDADDPDFVLSPTTVTRLETQCPGVDTATFMSKTYLYNVFTGGETQEQADTHWSPFPIIPESEHSPDVFTMQALRGWLPTAGNDAFAFVNLGDVDRVGHIDETGSLLRAAAARKAAIVNTDRLVGEFVGELKSSGMWSSSVLMIVSDHGMDWSLPNRIVNLASALEAEGFTNGADFKIAQNGGADLVYVTDPGDVEQIADIVRSVEGVALVLDTPSRRATYGLDHPAAGDVVAFAAPGFRFSDPDLWSNPLPGNHGHPATQHTVLLIAGGHSSVSKIPKVVGGSAALPSRPQDAPGNLSIAPTVAKLFGLATADGEFDRPPLGVTAPDPAPCALPTPPE